MGSIGLESIHFGHIFNTMLYWLGYLLMAGGGLFLLYALWYVTGYPMKLTYWPITGNINENVTADRPKKNRVKWNKHKTAWLTLWPLFNKKEIEPFDSEYIYPGKNLYAFKYGEVYLPAELSVMDVKNPQFQIKPIPYYIRNWQTVQLKQNEEEFRKKNFWEENKYFLMVMITAVACCAVVAITVYYTYQYAGSQLVQAKNYANQVLSAVGQKAPN